MDVDKPPERREACAFVHTTCLPNNISPSTNIFEGSDCGHSRDELDYLELVKEVLTTNPHRLCFDHMVEWLLEYREALQGHVEERNKARINENSGRVAGVDGPLDYLETVYEVLAANPFGLCFDHMLDRLRKYSNLIQ